MMVERDEIGRSLYADDVRTPTALSMPLHHDLAFLQQERVCRTSWKTAVSQEAFWSI